MDLKPSIAPDAKTAAQFYPGELLVRDAEGSREERISRHRSVGQRHFTEREEPGPMAASDQDGQLRILPPARQQIYAHDSVRCSLTLDSPAQAWMRRVQSGQAGSAMVGGLGQLGAERATAEFGDWTTRIANGRIARPGAAAPAGHRAQHRHHPMGLGRSESVSARRDLHRQAQPDVNANGLIYGSPEESRDYLPVLDPVHNTISQVKTPYRDANTPGQPKPLQPSTFWGDEADLGHPHHRAQSDVRSARPPVVHGADSRQRQSRRSAKRDRV